MTRTDLGTTSLQIRGLQHRDIHSVTALTAGKWQRQGLNSEYLHRLHVNKISLRRQGWFPLCRFSLKAPRLGGKWSEGWMSSEQDFGKASACRCWPSVKKRWGFRVVTAISFSPCRTSLQQKSTNIFSEPGLWYHDLITQVLPQLTFLVKILTEKIHT